MKNIFKKNQIIISALAIMIIIAGYLSLTNKDKPDDALQTSGENGLEVVTDVDLSQLAQSGTTNGDTTTTDNGTTAVDGVNKAADGSNTNTTTDIKATDTNATDNNETAPVESQTGMEELGDISDEDILHTGTDVTDHAELDLEDGVPGEAVLVSATINPSYFVSNRVEREQMRARNKDTYKEIIESAEVAENLKEEAIEKLIELTDIAEKEKNTEIALEARGFSDALVSINNGAVDVVINTASISDQQLAIIEDTVKNKTDIPVTKMTILPVVMEE